MVAGLALVVCCDTLRQMLRSDCIRGIAIATDAEPKFRSDSINQAPDCRHDPLYISLGVPHNIKYLLPVGDPQDPGLVVIQPKLWMEEILHHLHNRHLL